MNIFKTIAVLVSVGIMIIIAIPASIIIFYICCAIMQVVAWMFGVTYEAANSVCFIYLEPALVTLTAMIAALFMMYKLKPKIIWIPLSIIYLVPYYITCFVIWSHYYPLGLDGACRLAYKDLETLGNLTGVGYIAINLFLFIVLFLALTAFNILITRLCCKHKSLPRSSAARIYRTNINV